MDHQFGFVELWLNGVHVVPLTPLATLYSGQGSYLKQGFYRDHFGAVSRVYQTGVTRFTAGQR